MSFDGCILRARVVFHAIEFLILLTLLDFASPSVNYLGRWRLINADLFVEVSNVKHTLVSDGTDYL